MNRPLTTKETNELLCTIDQKPAAPVMTRAQKLHHWAALIRATPGALQIYSNLERRVHDWDQLTHSGTPFALAFADPVLREAGLKSGSVGEAARFFELSPGEMHAFSCDCGGAITNTDMASRIDAIATTMPNITATEVGQRVSDVFRSMFRAG